LNLLYAGFSKLPADFTFCLKNIFNNNFSVHFKMKVPGKNLNLFGLMLTVILAVLITPESVSQVFVKNDEIVFEKIFFQNNNTFDIVESIQQDSFGFIWIGSKDGLYRYDGIKFKAYQFDREDPNSLSNNVVRNIFIDSKNNMWVATEFGLNLYDLKNDNFTRFFSIKNDPSTLAADFITCITEDKKGNLWMTSNIGGLCMFDYLSGKFTRYCRDSPQDKKITTNNLSSLYLDNEGTIWIGTLDSGVIYFKPGNAFSYLKPGARDGKHLFGNNVRAIAEGPDGKIWFGTNGQGISCFDRLKKEFNYFSNDPKKINSLGGNFISCFYKDSQYRFWICTDGGGLNLYQSGKPGFVNFRNNPLDESSISSDIVRTIFEDHTGNFWIGNYNATIDYINSRRKKFYNVENRSGCQNCLTGKQVNAVFIDSENKIWTAIDGEGVNMFDPKTKKFRYLKHNTEDPTSLANDKPICFAEDNIGNIWIGFFEGGLGCFQKNNGKFVNFFPDGTNKNLHGRQVWDLMVDNGNLWIATEYGTEILDLKNKLFTILTEGREKDIETEKIINWTIHKDKKGRILIGTLEGLRVYYPEKGNFECYMPDFSNPDALSDKWVSCIFEDSKGQIWLGTKGGGLNLWLQPENKFRCFTKKDGLSDNFIKSIQEDNSGNLWISTNSGLTKFNFDTLSFELYNVDDGLQGNRFMANASCKDENGYIYFGGTKGLTFFNPDDIKNNDIVPSVHITGISLFNSEIDVHTANSPLKKNIILQKEIYLSYKQSVITIDFAALNYDHRRENTYKYKLENLDKDWIFIGQQHSVTFSYLEPGSYTFRVIASNNDNVWNTKGTSIKLIISPPFYKTYWFIAFEILIIILIVVGIYHIRSRNIRNTNNKLYKLVNERTHLLEERNKEIIHQNREMVVQRDLATSQRDQIIKQNEELAIHRNKLSELVDTRTKELMEAKQKAEENNKLKTIFLEVISHEIRTPMNAILGFINLLSEKIDDPKNRTYYLRILNESGKNLLRLIEDIIDFSRLQTGELQVNIEPCNISELIKQLVSIYRERASREKPQINILSVIPDDNIIINTDSKKLVQIFSRLADNSMKFTEKGYIKLGITENNPGSVTFFVEDTGIGIPPENVGSLFERLYNYDQNSPDKLSRESGLGLALSKHLTELLGGKIWVESSGNYGSIFYFTIICKKIIETNEIQNDDADSRMYYWPGKKIVAEDEETNFLLIEAILKETEIEILHAADGIEFLEIIEKNPQVDLVLLDIRMPRLNGLNAIKIVRESMKNIPVIAQTAYDHAYHRQLAMESGCNHFLIKPLRKEELLSLVKTYLG
jgi:signal transduction histidine kinase/ligand-binding sensor domain-containing protein/CheY-like chemotaxis protein